MRHVLGTIRSWAARSHVVWTYASVVAAFRALPRRVLVLRYHALGLPDAVAAYASAGISVTPERFAEHVGGSFGGRQLQAPIEDRLELLPALAGHRD